MKDIAELLARIWISFVFIYEALDSLIFFHKTKATLTAYGIVWQQDMILRVSVFILIVGAILVLIGYYAKIGAILLLLYWLPMTLIVYSFWDDPMEIRRLHTLYFMRNLALCGGLILIMVHGAGKYSIKRLIYILKVPH